ncbi:acyl carrier protein [Aquibium sp. A9E412]|uniref:acyl carrier protein n=1 Tax=Aquibium sp. A9E412 TaxID=2976767 RepID=UPI0025AEDFC0|nr:acyl carrier protein [Aquibium sp. A9E412]MDN2567315.1 acyl carrier protein [Aquibium sp. A9E412]
MSEGFHDKIRAFIVETFLFGDDSEPLPGDLSLLENDLVDSTGVLELVGFLEADFGLAVDDADIVPANLDTVDRIAAFVERKKAA